MLTKECLFDGSAFCNRLVVPGWRACTEYLGSSLKLLASLWRGSGKVGDLKSLRDGVGSG